MELKGKRILVTGGCGFKGSHLAEQLSKENEVKIIDNLSSGTLTNIRGIKDRVICAKRDIRERGIETEFNDIDVVFHEAAQTFISTSLESPLFDADVNILGTLNILEDLWRWELYTGFHSRGRTAVLIFQTHKRMKNFINVFLALLCDLYARFFQHFRHVSQIARHIGFLAVVQLLQPISNVLSDNTSIFNNQYFSLLYLFECDYKCCSLAPIQCNLTV